MTGYGVIIRGSLYFLIALLTPLASAVADGAQNGQWPTGQTLVAATLGGLVAGLVSLRAYLDGSNERFEARRNGTTP
jgi:hypothetical protein